MLPLSSSASATLQRGHGIPYNSIDICELLVGCDRNGLDQELVSAFGIRGRLLLHRLQENGDLDLLPRLDATRVWADAVSRLLSGPSLGRMDEGTYCFGAVVLTWKQKIVSIPTAMYLWVYKGIP
jgi:hypothetical protein